MLPFGFDRSAVNSSYRVGRRIGGSPKTCSETERQRANGNDDQRTTPSPITNATMSQQLHLAVTGRSAPGLYILELHKADITSVTDFSSVRIRNVGYEMQDVGCTPLAVRIRDSYQVCLQAYGKPLRIGSALSRWVFELSPKQEARPNQCPPLWALAADLSVPIRIP